MDEIKQPVPCVIGISMYYPDADPLLLFRLIVEPDLLYCFLLGIADGT